MNVGLGESEGFIVATRPVCLIGVGLGGEPRRVGRRHTRIPADAYEWMDSRDDLGNVGQICAVRDHLPELLVTALPLFRPERLARPLEKGYA